MGALQQALSGYTPPSSAGTAGDASTQAQPAPQAQPQPAPNAPATPDTSQTAQQILMIAPTGEAAYVPPGQVASYEAKGASVGIRMTAPDGKEKAIVPFSKQDAYQKQGATWDSSPDNDAAKAFLTQRQQQAQGDSEDEQDEQKRLIESGETPGAVTMQPKRTAVALGGMLAVGGAAGVVSGLTAASAITEEAATGLVDEFGAPIAREIVKQGPSILGKGFQAATQWATAHPTLVKEIIKVAGIAGAIKVFGTMSKLEKEFGK